MIYPNGTVLHYHYTKRDQLASIAEDTTQVVAYTYDFNGNRINKILENGTNTNYTYDDANRMLSVDNLKGSASFARFDYGYDKVNRRTYVQRDNDKGDIYKYDAIDQVTDVLYNVTDPAGNASNPLRTVNYDWDSAGNRKTVTDNAVVTNYTTNKLNEYTKIDDDKLAYNEKGDLKTYNGWTYKYDAQDRLINATNSGTTVDFVYDARNRCIKRTINGTSIFFYYDDWNLIEERNANKTEIAHYINATYVDEILKKVTPSETVYYHHDALGSVTHLTDATGKVVEKYSYDVFGAPTIRNSNRDSLANSALGNRFMFTDREYIKELGLYDYRNRMYSDTLGRFLQTDPLRFNAGDVNLYRYVGNKVVNLVDPIGLIPVTVTVIGTCTPKNATEKCLSDSASASVTGESGNYKIITDAIKALHVEARIAAAALCGVCCQFNEIGADVEYDKNEKPKK
jgi:RHS repeat-associated protein